MRIKWYPALPEAGTLPFPSAISSLDFSSHPWVEGGIGEVYGVKRPYNRAKPIDYAKDLTPCEPAEVFIVGEVLDLDAPAQLYNEDGFPLCCLNMAAPQGGAVVGGSAFVLSGSPIAPGTCVDANSAFGPYPMEFWLTGDAVTWFDLPPTGGGWPGGFRWISDNSGGSLSWDVIAWFVFCASDNGSISGTGVPEFVPTLFSGPFDPVSLKVTTVGPGPHVIKFQPEAPPP